MNIITPGGATVMTERGSRLGKGHTARTVTQRSAQKLKNRLFSKVFKRNFCATAGVEYMMKLSKTAIHEFSAAWYWTIQKSRQKNQ